MRPDFLCISNFGRDQANSIKQAVDFGLKQQAKIVVPVILHNQRLAVGPEVFEGVVGGANYYWGLESQLPSAKAFNDAYRAANGGAIPTDYGAYGYTGLSSLLMAMQVAGGTDTDKVIAALEGSEIRRGQGSAKLPEVRSPVGAVGPCARVAEKGRHEERRRPVQGRRQRAASEKVLRELHRTWLPRLTKAPTLQWIPNSS